MATTRGWAMKGNIVNLVNYILDVGNDREKTDNGKYVLTSSSNRPMAEAFEWKCNQSNNQSESVGFHFQLSLPSGEGSADPSRSSHSTNISWHSVTLMIKIQKSIQFFNNVWTNTIEIFNLETLISV